jgi:hypothetical protein
MLGAAPSRTFSMPKCPMVALFFWVLAICEEKHFMMAG